MRWLPLLLLLLVVAAVNAQTTGIRAIAPPPKSSFDRPGMFSLVGARIGTTGSTASVNAGMELARRIAGATGLLLETTIISSDTVPPGTIFVADTLDPASYMVRGEQRPNAEGYLIDVTDNRAVILGSGAMQGIAAFVQMIGPDKTVGGAHVWDESDYPVRWAMARQNLRGAGAITRLRSLLDTMAAYRLNGIQHSDFKYGILGEQPAYYFDSVQRFETLCAERGISIIPGTASVGYSENILWHNPNLAEGVESRARYIIEGDTARIIPEPNVVLPNSGFESIDAGGKFTGWSFYDDNVISPDSSVAHSGRMSGRGSNFNGANARFSRLMPCQPFRHYRMSAWLRTQGLKGTVQLLAIGTDGTNSRVLTSTQFSIPSTTSGWQQVQTSFNTLNFPQVRLYCGVWGGSAGTIWWDDFTVEDAGVMNVLRRPGAPLHLHNARTGAEYREGIDLDSIVDRTMLAAHGIYPIHPAPAIRRRAGASLANGDTVEMSWFHTLTTIDDGTGVGQNMVALSEPETYTLLEDEARRIDTLYGPESWMLNHDEIRFFGWDSASVVRGLGAAGLLADNLTRSYNIIEQTHPGAHCFVWSDMFDSLHNAVPNYYLVNGSLLNVWDSIPHQITMVNWNYGQRDSSLRFFSDNLFHQITSPYYDAGNADGIRAWRLSMEGVPNVDGMMYTTWSDDYSFLRQFAYYAWGAGPRIIHTPLDTTVLPASPGNPTTINFTAEVDPDPYDPADSIVSVVATLDDHGPSLPAITQTTLHRAGANTWSGSIEWAGWNGFTYHIEARNAQGLLRTTPEYEVLRSGRSSVDGRASTDFALRVEPNPARDAATIHISQPGSWHLEIVDERGVARVTTSGVSQEEIAIPLDLSTLSTGIYRCVLRTTLGVQTSALHVVR